MKRIICTALLLSVAACSGSDVDETESVGESSEALNGIVNNPGFLTKKNFPNQPNELTRRSNTTTYYNAVGANADGNGSSIATQLGTLTAFRNKYFSGWSEVITKYYNRGDLGLGREMHCVDRTSGGDGQVACYVTNFVAAKLDANGNFSEFSFGLSPNIAFDNMLASPPRPVATVAMVYRPNVAAGKDKVIFVVYDANGALTNTAPLDRHGLNFFNAFKTNPNPDPAVFGTPGVNFNNHIPSNCLNCHGGSYNSTGSPKVANAFFLPFDLDQFEYKDAAGLRRADQLTAFRNLNQIARRVAFRSTSNKNNSIVKQIDGWHGNTAQSETLVKNFDSNFVPAGWNGNANDINAYRGVVRRSCRGCHIAVNKSGAPELNFDTAFDFQLFAQAAAIDIKNHTMAHALQAQREYWQSSQHLSLITYLETFNPNGALLLRSAGPDRVITLDPHLDTSTH